MNVHRITVHRITIHKLFYKLIIIIATTLWFEILSTSFYFSHVTNKAFNGQA